APAASPGKRRSRRSAAPPTRPPRRCCARPPRASDRDRRSSRRTASPPRRRGGSRDKGERSCPARAPKRKEPPHRQRQPEREDASRTPRGRPCPTVAGTDVAARPRRQSVGGDTNSYNFGTRGDRL